MAWETILVVASLATTAYSAYSAIESSHDKPPTPYDMGFRPDTTAADAAAMAEATRMKKKRALASTIKTSPEGVMEPPKLGKEKLGD